MGNSFKFFMTRNQTKQGNTVFGAEFSKLSADSLRSVAKRIGLNNSQMCRLALAYYIKDVCPDFDPTSIPEIQRDVNLSKLYNNVNLV